MASSPASTPTPASNTPGTSTTPPALLEATARSTVLWQDDLRSLFEQAKDRFPDVVWELTDDDDGDSTGTDEVWGHKGECYLCHRALIACYGSSSACSGPGPDLTDHTSMVTLDSLMLKS